MAGMAAPLLVGSTLLSAYTGIQQGKAASRAADYKASQLEQRAKQQRAVSQRQANEARRRARLMESRTLALAAASGGGVSDPTIVNIMAGISTEGEYSAQTALYEGEERARGSEMEAQATRYEGRQAKRAGYLKAATSLLSLGSGFAEKYSPTSDFATYDIGT